MSNHYSTVFSDNFIVDFGFSHCQFWLFAGQCVQKRPVAFNTQGFADILTDRQLSIREPI